jgi:beta-lactamase class C
MWNGAGPIPAGLMPMVFDDLLGLNHVDWAGVEGSVHTAPAATTKKAAATNKAATTKKAAATKKTAPAKATTKKKKKP